MSNVELLPLPAIKVGAWPNYTECQVQDYATACVEANTEALRVEVERLKRMLGDCYVEAGADTDGNEPSRMYAQALSAVQDLRRDYDETLAEPDYKGRAERLAEALQEASQYASASAKFTGSTEYAQGARDAMTEMSDKLDAALHPTAQ